MKRRSRSSSAGGPARLETGIAGLDTITRGGFLRGGIYIVAGKPGAGKTILSNQVAFHHAKNGGRAVYATLLAETHGRLLQQIGALSFFDESMVGNRIQYLNALDAVLDDGLPGLLKLVRQMVRDQKATLLVLDGMVTAAQLANSDMEYRSFIRELQTWVATVECTVLLVTSAGVSGDAAEHTMVDGIVELMSERVRMRNVRHVAITKFRGSGTMEGQHTYVIGDDGVRIHPRFEAESLPDGAPGSTPRPTGVPGLDPLLGGGFFPGSTSLVLGSSGAGKTILGMQFVAAAAARGEQALHHSFYESPEALVAKATRLGLPYKKLLKEGRLNITWQKPAEPLLDAVVYKLLDDLTRTKATTLFIDGFVGFRTTAYPERVSTVFSAVSEELLRRKVTTLISDETRELFVRDVEVPTQNVSAIFHNILFMRQVQNGSATSALQHALWIMKTRDAKHDHRAFGFEITKGGVAVLGPLDQARPDDSPQSRRRVRTKSPSRKAR